VLLLVPDLFAFVCLQDYNALLYAFNQLFTKVGIHGLPCSILSTAMLH
jgi:hypothetical protein